MPPARKFAINLSLTVSYGTRWAHTYDRLNTLTDG